MQTPYSRVRLDPCEARPAFDCDDADLNEYFHTDSIKACKELVAVSYVIYDDNKQAIAFYCVSNDSIRRELASGERWKKIKKELPPEKRYKSLPAVKIGRFAVAKNCQGKGIGKNLMMSIKYDFVNGNKTGCRFIIVDAYKNSANFYQQNGFEFLTGSDEGKETRLMYFDLIKYVNHSEQ